MKKKGIRVPGIGHRIKSKDNRDKRVELLIAYARRFFPGTRYLDYAQRVEAYTLQKAANLVMNVDGCIGALFLDLLHSSSMFSEVRVRVHSLIAALESCIRCLDGLMFSVRKCRPESYIQCVCPEVQREEAI